MPGVGRRDDFVRVKVGVGALLRLVWKVKATQRRKVTEHLVRLGSGRRSYSVRFQHGTMSICLCDTLRKSRRKN